MQFLYFGRILFMLLFTMNMVSASTLLESHPSPYIAMHSNDPVDWHAWGSSILNQARRENRLIYVSSGYFTCHWCHLMHEETYLNEKIAQMLNQYFIPVKIDRELNPALDALLLNFVEHTRGAAGWPLNVFITPDGYPLVGFTYLPPNRFTILATRLRTYWQQDPERLKQMAYEGFLAMYPPPQQPAAPLTVTSADHYRQLFLEQALFFADNIKGGFGDDSKYPQVPQLELLLTLHQQHPSAELATFLQLTLDNMAHWGLYDRVGGGFFHHTVDAAWKQPYFEKTLYDNALLAQLYLRAAKYFNATHYEAIAFETIDFVLREFASVEGGLIAELSATDDSNEYYYLWSFEELANILNEQELPLLQAAWQLSGATVFTDNHYLPYYQHSIEELATQFQREVAEVDRLFTQARPKLLQARQQRPPLPRDNKKLAGWNGLMLSTLALATHFRDDNRYRQAGQKLRDYLLNSLWQRKRLLRALGPQGPIGEASLEDYAYVAQGLLDWYEVSDNPQDLAWAQQLVHFAWQTFYDQHWYLAEPQLLPMEAGVNLVADDPLPSPAAILIDLRLRLDSVDKTVYNAAALGQEVIVEWPLLHATHIGVIQKMRPLLD